MHHGFYKRWSLLGFVLLSLTLIGGCAGKPTLLFLGDSITEAHVFVEAVGEELSGYRVVNRGRGGETLTGTSEAQFPGRRPQLHDRLAKELRRWRPDWVVACYGMNDGLFHPFDWVRFEAYQAGIKKLIEASLDAGARVVLMTPPPFARSGAVTDPGYALEAHIASVLAAHTEGRAKADAESTRYGYYSPYLYYDDVLSVYSAWLHTLAQPDRVWVIDLRTPLLNRLDLAYDDDDPVHPNREGHHIIAQAFLEAWGEMDD